MSATTRSIVVDKVDYWRSRLKKLYAGPSSQVSAVMYQTYVREHLLEVKDYKPAVELDEHLKISIVSIRRIKLDQQDHCTKKDYQKHASEHYLSQYGYLLKSLGIPKSFAAKPLIYNLGYVGQKLSFLGIKEDVVELQKADRTTSHRNLSVNPWFVAESTADDSDRWTTFPIECSKAVLSMQALNVENKMMQELISDRLEASKNRWFSLSPLPNAKKSESGNMTCSISNDVSSTPHPATASSSFASSGTRGVQKTREDVTDVALYYPVVANRQHQQSDVETLFRSPIKDEESLQSVKLIPSKSNYDDTQGAIVQLSSVAKARDAFDDTNGKDSLCNKRGRIMKLRPAPTRSNTRMKNS